MNIFLTVLNNMWLFIFLLLESILIISLIAFYWRMKDAEAWERRYREMNRDFERLTYENFKTIERMKVWQKNQEDREKQLLERIKFLENNQK